MSLLEVLVAINSTGVLGGLFFLVRFSYTVGRVMKNIEAMETRLVELEKQNVDVALERTSGLISMLRAEQQTMHTTNTNQLTALAARIESVARNLHDLRNQLMEKFIAIDK